MYYAIGKYKFWNDIKRDVINREGMNCFICDSNNYQQLHESWEYIPKDKIRKLVSMHLFCKPCHGIAHYLNSRQRTSKTHFMKINECSLEDFKGYLSDIKCLSESMKDIDWDYDFGEFSMYPYLNPNDTREIIFAMRELAKKDEESGLWWPHVLNWGSPEEMERVKKENMEETIRFYHKYFNNIK